MNVVVNQDQDTFVANIIGEVDADNCDALRAAVLEPAVASSNVVLDLSQLTFLDSSGISELLTISETVTGRGQQFEVRNPTPAVRRVLEITGLLQYFGLE